MSLPYADAQEWARDQSLANVPLLARLEAFAFQHHRDVVATFGAHGADLAARWAPPPSRVRRAGSVLLGVLAVIALASPVLGVAVYLQDPARFPTAEEVPAGVAVPFASACFVVAALVQVVLWVLWFRGGARWSPELLGIAAVSGVLAAGAAIALPRIAREGGVEAPGYGAVIVTLVLAAGLVVAILARRRVRPDEVEDPGPPPPPSLSDREVARRAAAALPPAERDRVRADRDAALRVLAERGLLDDDELGRALGADLGTLFALDPIRPG